MYNFLIEFYSEEMPFSILENTSKSISLLLENEFRREKFNFEKNDYFYSPTRLTFAFQDLKINKKLINDMIRGPSTKANTLAIAGFAKSLNISKDKLIKKNTSKGEYFFYEKKMENFNQETVLKKVIDIVLKKVSWKKSMRWGSNNLKWARPLKNILCFFEDKVLMFKLEHLVSSDMTFIGNHLEKKKVIIKNISHYFKTLEENNVQISQCKRMAYILENATKIAKNLNLIFNINKSLLRDVVALVEKPYLFQANFKKKFLQLPKEILTTSMIKHQKYFPLHNDKSVLSNSFILVSNVASNDKGLLIVDGNERVINARLEDAAFFWKKDLQSKFNSKEEDLKRLIFHGDLGNLFDKVKRLQFLAEMISKKMKLTEDETQNLKKATKLCKNDLVSQVVREFPSLQGVMGYYYSKELGNNHYVSLAIKEHYKPLGQDENIPSIKIGKILSLIDKIDTLSGFFFIDNPPSSTKDPYALRRMAIGIIRILFEGKLDLNLSQAFIFAIDLYSKSNFNDGTFKNLEKRNVVTNLAKFIIERLDNLIKEKKEINPIILKSLKINYSDLNIKEIYENAIFLNAFIHSNKGTMFLASIKRVFNIVEEKNKEIENGDICEELLSEKDELSLYNTYKNLLNKSNYKYTDAINYLPSLSKHINSFFDNVKINDDDINLKKNRLILLTKLKNKVNQISDFSVLIKGQES